MSNSALAFGRNDATRYGGSPRSSKVSATERPGWPSRNFTMAPPYSSTLSAVELRVVEPL